MRRTWWLAALAMFLTVGACTRSPSGGGGDEQVGDVPAERASRTPDSSMASNTESPPGPFVLDDPELVARNNYGVGLMGRFEYEAARAVFEELHTAHPNWHDVKVNLAIATFNRQQEGDEARGRALLEEVIAVDPGNLRANYCVGLLLMRTGEMQTARLHFQRVVNSDRQDPYAAYALGQCMEAQHPELATKSYLKAIELDPYLRSAYYRAFQMLQRQGRSEEAQAYFEEFQRLETNPRARLVETKYTRMGPKADAVSVDISDRPDFPPLAPEGPPFVDPVALVGEAPGGWTGLDAAPGATTVDIDGDGDQDVFVSNGRDGTGGVFNAVALNDGQGRFTLAPDHALARIDAVRAALWGDVDNDGLVDVYLCRAGPNRLLRQEAPGVWRDVTASSGTDNGALDTVDGAIFDSDHDGDLDLFCVNGDGPNELLINNLDGTFRSIAAERGLTGAIRSRQVIPVDLDRDRDLDILVVNAQPPHEVHRNDRLWQYESDAKGWEMFVRSPLTAAVAGDRDADGDVEIYGLRSDGFVDVLTEGGAPRRLSIQQMRSPGATPRGIALLDVLGNGEQDIVLSSSGGWLVAPFGDRQPLFLSPGFGAGPALLVATPVVLDAVRGPSILAVRDGAAPLVWHPGPGRHTFAAMTFSGREDLADSMRSNASGIGTEVAARIGSRWVVARSPEPVSAPGQSLQPVTIGLGGADRIDYVSIDWSDGVFQSEIDLAQGGPHAITETQRQLSSCPVLFAWDGERFAFVTDVLGVGGMGYLLTPDSYATPRSRERLLLPDGLLAPRDGRYQLKITEPMEEACYLDAVALDVYDLPPGWSMTVDEYMAVEGPQPSGDPRFYRRLVRPSRATNDRGEDVTSQVMEIDHVAPPVGPLDRRFIGRLEPDHVLTLEFGAPLDTGPGDPLLVIDGWVEYPYSQTMFSAWQASAEWRAPTVEALDAYGDWHVVQERFGYPAGMPRQMSVALHLPEGTTALRLSSNQELYWDRIAVAFAEPCPNVVHRTIAPVAARLDAPGFPRRTTHAQRRPAYDWEHRAPLWDTKRLRGFYTELGDVANLVGAGADDALAIFGPGEGVHVEFESLSPPPPAGWSRRFVLDAVGWCKDMDMLTRDGETVGPLPATGPPDAPGRRALHGRYNTRYQSGR